MKTVSNKLGLLARLGMTAAAVLLSQQAMAAGTTAGTNVTNSASVTYDVGGITQNAVGSNNADFVVDRRVDFTLAGDGDTEVVTPGQTGLTFDLTLQNDSNDTLDFVITVEQVLSGDPDATVNTFADNDADVSNLVLVTATVDDLGEDAQTTISLTGEAALALSNGDVANIRVIAVALDSGGAALSDDSGSGDVAGTVQNVFADIADGIGNQEFGYDGIRVESASLLITKSSVVEWDPINLGTNAKAIPGAVVEYLVSIANSGSADALTVTIQDTIDPSAAFVDSTNNPVSVGNEPYDGGASNVQFGPDPGSSFCVAESGGVDTNTDGCVRNGAALTIAVPDVLQGNTVEVRFQILIL